jgi:uncharacterized protein YkwD
MLKHLPLVSLWLLLAGCGGGGMGAPAPSDSTHGDEVAACLAQSNQYRASVGLAAFARSTDLEAYATRAAENDGAAHVGHQYFRSTNGGGVAMAENEIPWWSTSRGSVGQIIQQGLAGMWAEGPGGGHYENIRGPYTQSGCGVSVQNGEVTVVQAFR